MMSETTVYPASARKEMSFNRWSYHEPVLTRRTDHWSKLRCKSYKLAQLPTGSFISFCKPSEVQKYSRSNLGLPETTTVTSSGTLAPIGCPNFNHLLQQRLHNPHLVAPTAPLDSRGYDKGAKPPPSAYSQRAKQGFQYWFNEPTTKARSGKGNTLGSKGTYLGIGEPRL